MSNPTTSGQRKIRARRERKSKHFYSDDNVYHCDCMQNMIFVFPPAIAEDTFVHHLGAGYIRAYLQQHGIETSQFATLRKMTIPEIITGILKYKPEIVGFTCYDTNYVYVRILAKMLKKKDPSLTVVLGGPTATFSDKTVMNHTPEFDICVVGEGEQTVLELFQKGFSDLESIKGVTFRSGNELVSTGRRPLLSSGVKGKELDIIPSPYLTGLVPPDGTAGILTARGCVYRCTYCNFAIMFNHTIRHHSIERVVAELKLLEENWKPTSKMDMVIINDDTFSLDVDRAKALCQKIIDEGIHLPFLLETRADHCDEELIELMRDAGVKTINFGLESTSCKVLRAVKKVAPYKEEEFLEQVKNCVQWAKEAGMSTSVSVIFGLPEEGIKEAEETLNFIKELDVDEYASNYLQICAGTELFRTRKEYGLDVYPSSFFLPYLIQHAYDVWKIPLLPKSHLERGLAQWKRTYCGMLSYEVDRTENSYEYLMLKKMPVNNEEVCVWLQKNCVLPLSVVDITGTTKEEGIHNLEFLLRGGVPVGPYYVVVKNGQPRLLYLPQFVGLPVGVPETPFHRYEKGTEGLFTCEESQDVKALNQFVDNYIQEGILSFPVQDLPGTLVGACRWGESVCPAVSGGVLVLDGEHVLPCYYGEGVGMIGDSIQNLRENVKTMLREKEEERECTNCAVKRECSRCLFPQPFTDVEFCRLRRDYPGVSKLATVMKWLRRFYQSKDEATFKMRVDTQAPPLFYQGELSQGSPLPKVRSDVRLCSLNGRGAAFITEEFQPYWLGSTLAVILEAFQLGIGEESLISYLCESGASQEKASKAVSDAVSIFGKMGFLE